MPFGFSRLQVVSGDCSRRVFLIPPQSATITIYSKIKEFGKRLNESCRHRNNRQTLTNHRIHHRIMTKTAAIPLFKQTCMIDTVRESRTADSAGWRCNERTVS